MKLFLILIALVPLLLVPSLAQAQMQDYMGIYFDPDGFSNCLEASTVTPFTTLDIYVILNQPSAHFLYGFEFGMTVDGPGLLLAVEFYGEALDVGSMGNHIVGLGTPIETQEATILARYDFLYTSSSNEIVCFNLGGSDPSSLDPEYPTLLLADGELVSVSIDPGPYANCTAVIGDCVMPTTTRSFDSLKSLYR